MQLKIKVEKYIMKWFTVVGVQVDYKTDPETAHMKINSWVVIY